MKPAAVLSRLPVQAPPIARVNSAARSGSNCSTRAPLRSSSAAGRGEPTTAVIQAESRRKLLLAPIRPHPLEHLLDMRDRGFRLDAVPEVEDQPAGGVILQHVVDGAIERGTAGDQRQGIEIALNRDAVLH